MTFSHFSPCHIRKDDCGFATAKSGKSKLQRLLLFFHPPASFVICVGPRFMTLRFCPHMILKCWENMSASFRSVYSHVGVIRMMRALWWLVTKLSQKGGVKGKKKKKVKHRLYSNRAHKLLLFWKTGKMFLWQVKSAKNSQIKTFMVMCLIVGICLFINCIPLELAKVLF